jgi:ABC-2 type transport system permease protein
MKYIRFIIRRERIISLIWLVSLSVFALLLAVMYPGLFPDKTAMQGMIITMNTPAMVAVMGSVYGLDCMTPAIMMSQNCLLWFAIVVTVMNIFFVNRYTRTDEELGRQEMLISLSIGRWTNSLSVIFLSFVLNLTLALLIAVFTYLPHLDGGSMTGALVYGLSIGMQGFLFAMLTLLAAQVFSTARDSMGAAFVLMGISYMLRAYGDMNGNILSYISPLGLGLKVEAFYSNDVIPIVVLFIESVVIAVLALWINARRDIGMGIIPARKGKAHASNFLQTPTGFAWRLLRTNFFAWGVGIFAIGASYGSVIGELDHFVTGNDMIKQMLEGNGGASTLVDAFTALLNSIMALLIAIPLINSINRLRSEEQHGRLEPIIATSVSKKTVFGSFILIAVLESILFTFLGAVGLYATASSSGLVSFETLIKAGFVYLPALFVMFALAVFMVGAFPKLKFFVWIVFAYSFVTFYFGRFFNIPEAVLKLSPFGNIPQLPAETFSAIPLVVMSGISFALIAGGIILFEKREIRN